MKKIIISMAIILTIVIVFACSKSKTSDNNQITNENFLSKIIFCFSKIIFIFAAPKHIFLKLNAKSKNSPFCFQFLL